MGSETRFGYAVSDPNVTASRPIQRATAQFDAEALLDKLSQVADEAVAPELLGEYRAFYDLQAGGREDRRHRVYVLGVGGERIVAQHFVPAVSHGVVVMCHGYYDHVGLYGHLIEYLLGRALTVVAFDHPGHGLSTGPRADIDSFDRYVQTLDAVRQHAEGVLRQRATGWHWFGQSMGGAVILEYFDQRPPDAEELGHVVLFAPLVRPYAWWLNRWVFAVAKLTITERPRLIAPNADNQEFFNLQIKDPLQARVLPVRWVQSMVDWFTRFERRGQVSTPVKILQGYADRTVSWRHGYRVLTKRYPHASWHLIPNGQHHLVNESAEIRSGMWQWLDAQCDWD